MVSVLIDWLTITHKEWRQHEVLTPALIGKVCGEQPKTWKHRSGARGWAGIKTFVGLWDNGMLIVEATGASAQIVADQVAELVPQEGMSVARIDLQATVWVGDADAVIKTTVPARRYKCTLIQDLYSRGCTLYVGAPASDARLRMYNKTVEAGIAPDGGGEWLRIELQLRNRYADRAWASWRKRAHQGLFCEYIRKMLDERTYRMLRSAVEYGDEPVLDQDLDDDWIERRIYWMEHTVVPALRRLALHDERTLDLVKRAFGDIIGAGDGPSVYVSDW